MWIWDEPNELGQETRWLKAESSEMRVLFCLSVGVSFRGVLWLGEAEATTLRVVFEQVYFNLTSVHIQALGFFRP